MLLGDFMYKYSINEKNNEYLSKKINDLVDRLSDHDEVECVYITNFILGGFLKGYYIGLEIVFSDEFYYKIKSSGITTFCELYTSVISKNLYKNNCIIHFNVHSNKRSNYFANYGMIYDFLLNSEILYDKTGEYTERKKYASNLKYKEGFDNLFEFEPPLKLNKKILD